MTSEAARAGPTPESVTSLAQAASMPGLSQAEPAITKAASTPGLSQTEQAPAEPRILPAEPGRYALVVIDSTARELDRTFTYLIPSQAGPVRPGSVVEVPFGSRRVAGFVMELSPACDLAPERLKPVVRVLDPEPFFGQVMLNLVGWMVAYYGSTWRDALLTAVPAPVLGAVRARLTRKTRAQRKTAAAPAVEAYPQPSLTADQQGALEAIREARHSGGRVLLFGITGSGKTEVYLQSVQETLEQDRQAVVLVPEVALTPQAVERYRGRLGEQVGVLHSGLAGPERREQWWKLRRGELGVALGTRSAVFAPLEKPGLFVLDEEHDSSYKQDQSPRYHARQVAVRRAAESGAAVVLGSATPCLETFYLAQTGYYRLVELPRRACGQELPPVTLLDMRGQRFRRGEQRLLSAVLVERMRATLRAGQQVVLLLNRRGFANYVQCAGCGHVEKCPHCSISLTYHRAARSMCCHYCGHVSPPHDLCPGCGQAELAPRGAGTERLEGELTECFPGVEVARMDRDTTARPGQHAEILARFARGEARVLLGTQMVAKGLDFPDVTLVGVVNADAGLNLPDFRAGERTFQLLTQVAGRAGRGRHPGEVLVQTLQPEHPCLIAASGHDYSGFYRQELALRQQLGYPPFCRLLRLVVTGPEEAEVEREATRMARLVGPRLGPEQLLGPAPCPVERVRGRYRWQVLLRAPKLQDLVGVARTYFEHRAPGRRPDVSWAIDPDPQSLL